ncbi:unnamed protein product [Linum trigynum]|uniref:Uncharacterized protein n=1 Tax=Linum trigynum TaxID=586398 RepID=A0AAV2G1R7_9ROSI
MEIIKRQVEAKYQELRVKFLEVFNGEFTQKYDLIALKRLFLEHDAKQLLGVDEADPRVHELVIRQQQLAQELADLDGAIIARFAPVKDVIFREIDAILNQAAAAAADDAKVAHSEVLQAELMELRKQVDAIRNEAAAASISNDLSRLTI